MDMVPHVVEEALNVDRWADKTGLVSIPYLEIKYLGA